MRSHLAFLFTGGQIHVTIVFHFLNFDTVKRELTHLNYERH